jgi:regulator of replication initiation timing
MSEALASVRKLKQHCRTLLRENNSLKLELEFKSASNETNYRRSPLEDCSESSGTRVRELEKTVKALKEVKHSPNIVLIIITENLLFI